jgi:hypothetical protein
MPPKLIAAELLKSIEDANARPVSSVYSKISQVIYKNVYSALSRGTLPPNRAQ